MFSGQTWPAAFCLVDIQRCNTSFTRRQRLQKEWNSGQRSRRSVANTTEITEFGLKVFSLREKRDLDRIIFRAQEIPNHFFIKRGRSLTWNPYIQAYIHIYAFFLSHVCFLPPPLFPHLKYDKKNKITNNLIAKRISHFEIGKITYTSG